MCGEGGPVLTAGRCCDYRVDVTEFERRIAQALVDRRCSSRRELWVMLIRHRKAKHSALIDQSDCGIEAFAFIGSVYPINALETALGGPIAQQCRPRG